MRGSSATGVAGVDAVVITSDSNFNPVAAFPNLIETPIQTGSTASNTAPISASIRIDWNTKIARSTPLTFGSNDFQIIDPKADADSKYHPLLAKIGLYLLRFHNGNLSNAWSDANTHTWKSDVIGAAYDSYGPRPPVIIQNIPGWPRWMKQDKGILDPSEVDNYAQFAADLVKIVNRDQRRGIRYWEPLNEQDSAYKRAGKIDQLWIIYNKTAKAMKAVDPSIQVGGPALTYDDTNTLISFLKASGGNADFISWHRYASGNSKDSTDQIMAYTPKYAEQINNFRNLIQRYQPNRKIGMLLGEYNVNYDYRSRENRQNTQEGAAWFASVLKYLAESGIDMATSWNAKDGFYGLIDNARSPNLRPAAQVFTWANGSLVGDVVRTASDQASVEAFAVRQQGGSRSVLLINKSSGLATIQLKDERGIARSQRLESSVLKDDAVNLVNPISLSPYGVILLRFPK
jgi:Glycosyl hydrolases family 39